MRHVREQKSCGLQPQSPNPLAYEDQVVFVVQVFSHGVEYTGPPCFFKLSGGSAGALSFCFLTTWAEAGYAESCAAQLSIESAILGHLMPQCLQIDCCRL